MSTMLHEIRCSSCNKKLAEVQGDGTVTVRYKGMGVDGISICALTCPRCGAINRRIKTELAEAREAPESS